MNKKKQLDTTLYLVTDSSYHTEETFLRTVEEAPGFQRAVIAPVPDRRLGWLNISVRTRQGMMKSRWTYEEKAVRYEITTPSPAVIIIDGKEHQVEPGSYMFFGKY